MSGLYTYAIMTNLVKPSKGICAESLIIEAMRSRGRTIAVNLDTDLHLACVPARATKDDPASRFGKTLGANETPVYSREDFREYLKEAGRQRNAELIRDRTILLFLDQAPLKASLLALDALCFIVSPDHSSIPFIYSILNQLSDSDYPLSVKIVVAGEPKLEIAAEFFLGIQKEVEGLRGVSQDFSFAGNLYFDQDQFDLATGYNLPFIEAFAGGTAHGQLRYIIQRLMDRDLTRMRLAEGVHLDLLSKL